MGRRGLPGTVPGVDGRSTSWPVKKLLPDGPTVCRCGVEETGDATLYYRTSDSLLTLPLEHITGQKALRAL
jgi:hypothetical protein